MASVHVVELAPATTIGLQSVYTVQPSPSPAQRTHPTHPPLQDTGDTRETPAIDVCRGLMADGARVCVYDPQVEPQQVYQDLGTEKFEWDHPSPRSPPIAKTAIAIAPVRTRAWGQA